jgi:SHS2 domain-containing protein
MGYSFVDHTADVAVDLTGRTVEELFASAAQALTDTLTHLDAVRPLVTQSVTLESGALDDLLVDWLNELLYRFEVQNVLVSDATSPSPARRSVAPRRHHRRRAVRSVAPPVSRLGEKRDLPRVERHTRARNVDGTDSVQHLKR